MKSKNRIIKICFCLFLSLSLVVCGLSMAYAQGSAASGESAGAAAAGENAATGAGSGEATGEAGGTGSATGEGGTEAAGASGGSATVGANGAVGGETSTATGGTFSGTGENTGSGSDVSGAGGLGTDLGTDKGSTAVGGAATGEGAAQGLLASQLLTANGAEGGELLGAANPASTIDVTVPQSISFRNSGLSPTLLRMKNGFTITNNSTSQAVSITGVSITAQSEYTFVANSTDFESLDVDSKQFSMVLNYGGIEYDCSTASNIPEIPIGAATSVSLNFLGKISKVSTESNVNFAKLSLTIAAASSTEQNTSSTESDT